MTSYMFSITPYIFIPCFTFWTNGSCTETHRYILFSVRSTPEFTPDFSGFRVTRSVVLCVCFVDRCFSFFFWALRCLSFIDLRILIPLWYLLVIVLSVLHRFTDSDSPLWYLQTLVIVYITICHGIFLTLHWWLHV